MGTFYMNEAALRLPDGARDRSLTHVRLTAPSGATAAFIVERLVLPPERTLGAACAARVREASLRLHGFELLFEREGALDGEPALEVGVRWRDDAGDPVYTRQAHVVVDGTWMIVAIEGALDAHDELDELFEPILASFRLRRD